MVVDTPGKGNMWQRLELLTLLALPLGCIFYLLIAWKLSQNRSTDVASHTNNGQSTAAAARQREARSKAIKRVRILAKCFLVNLALMAPNVAMWQSGYYDASRDSAAAVRFLLEVAFVTYIAAGALNPVVYALVSTEMREALRRALGVGAHAPVAQRAVVMRNVTSGDRAAESSHLGQS